MSIRLMIVDDHKVLCDALKFRLEREDDIEVVGVAHDGEEALELICEVQPNIVITDINMPGMGGIHLTIAIKENYTEVGVLALSGFSDRDIVLRALRAGANGYLIKTTGMDELLRGIRSIYGGRNYLCPEASQIVVESMLGARSPKKQKPSRPSRRKFTPRETQVLEMMSAGFSWIEISKRLRISLGDVRFHQYGIMHKLDLQSAAELTKYAASHGAVDNFQTQTA